MQCTIASPIADRTIAVLNRHLQTRDVPPVTVVDPLPPGESGLQLRVDDTLAPESFRIHKLNADHLEVAGGSGLALLFGIGKMLRTGNFTDGVFSVGPWRGLSTPQCAFRCVYFATHFHNYYHNAPIDEIVEYIEDLALWGYNTIGVWPDKHHYDNADSPDFQAFMTNLKTILSAAKAIGMKVNLLTLANDAYRTTPQALLATHPGRPFYGCEICPSLPGGMDLILRNHQDTLDAMAGLEIDYVTLWSYDQGGCGCDACAPWGASGMLDCGRDVAALFKQHHPGCRIIYSTWLFDHKGEKEWEGLDAALAKGNGDYIDILLAETHGEYPRYPLEHTLPGNRPIINFPEISMRLIYPWGGSGANPMPRINANIWGQCAHLCQGGTLYSEGIFEDINKALYTGFYWSRNNTFEESMTEYARFELGVPEGWLPAWHKTLAMLEDNSLFAVFPQESREEGYDLSGKGCQAIRYCDGKAWSRSDFKADARQALETMQQIAVDQPAWAGNGWRWRLLMLRAIIDAERQRDGGHVSERCADCFDSLRDLYYADEQQTLATCCPPTRNRVLTG